MIPDPLTASHVNVTLPLPPTAVTFLTGLGYGDEAKLFSYGPRSGAEPEGFGRTPPNISFAGAFTPQSLQSATPAPIAKDAFPKLKSPPSASVKPGSESIV